MRNERTAWTRWLLIPVFGLWVAAGLVGCGNNRTSNNLQQGYAALNSGDYDAAIRSADATLQQSRGAAGGAGSAEALYLKGRALEMKPASSAQYRDNWQAARLAYIDGLSRSPSRKLEGLLHAGIANVAYFQDDYLTAANEWTAAYDKLDDPQTKAWILYRVGLSRQRLSQFGDADQIFQLVQQRFPSNVADSPAQRARAHAGARSFSVQMATFASAPNADAALANLRRDGVAAAKEIDSNGRSVVLAGPLPSYQQALAIKARYAAMYPNAIIVP